jgi:hypothetical protein
VEKANAKLSFDESLEELLARDKISDRITEFWGALK